MKLIIDNSPQHHKEILTMLRVTARLSNFSCSEKIEMVELFFKKLEADEQTRRVLKQQKKPAANDCNKA